MKVYGLYIKSHSEAPDWEQEISARNTEEAVEAFYQMLHGEYDKEWILNNMSGEAYDN